MKEFKTVAEINAYYFGDGTSTPKGMPTTAKLFSAICDVVKDTLTELFGDTIEDANAAAFISGGAVVSALECTKINDIDVYFKHPGVLRHLLKSKYGLDYHTSQIDDELWKCHVGVAREDGTLSNDVFCEPLCNTVAAITSNAITCKSGVQIITRFVGQPDIVTESFDYKHCTGVLFLNGGIVLDNGVLDSIASKTLVYTGDSHYPICALFRARKFISRGWRLPAGTMLRIIMQCRSLNLNNINVLREQLVGVDTLYFAWFLRKVEELNGDMSDTALDRILQEAFDYDEAKELRETTLVMG